ncbi:MAG: PAS domain S-box protein [Hyphomicrobiaceae bacterium]|nr:PAS domain S-box protein [Hyphomicrobiaceae bacterium]
MSELSARPQKQARTIRFRILSLIAFILLPLIIAFIWMTYDSASTKRRIVELERLEITNRISSAVDQQIAIPIGMLVGLAVADELFKGDFADFRRQALKLVPQPNITRIWAFTSKGKVKATTEIDPKDPADYALDPVTMERVFSGQPAVSPVRGEGLSQTTVVVSAPVKSNGKVIFGLAAEIRIASLSSIFADHGLGKNWAAAIVDRNNRYVARSLDAENRVGHEARPELGVVATGPNQSGTFENVTYEGVEMVNSFRRSELTGWTTVVAVPQTELEAPLRKALAWSLLGSTSLVLASLWLASLMASRISEPIQNLSQFASALAGGRPVPDAVHHITELDEVREALEKSMAQSARLAAIVASSGDAIMSIGLDGKIMSWNKGAEDLFGYTAEEIIGQPKSVLVPSRNKSEFTTHRSSVLSGESVRADSVRRKKNGQLVDVSLNSAPIRRPDGTIIGTSSIMHDISERKAEEEHRHFLMREVAHRSKNQLAIIQAIAGQTARHSGSIDDFIVAFRQRLQGLATSHDLLVNQNWRNIPLRRLVEHQIGILTGIKNESVEVSGPDVNLSPQASEAIGLALHELATNSIKYGALSVPTGRVEIRWTLQPSEDAKQNLVLEWQEHGGPPVTPPSSKGFGTQVLETLTARSVQGEAQTLYLAEGLHWILKFPAAMTGGPKET